MVVQLHFRACTRWLALAAIVLGGVLAAPVALAMTEADLATLEMDEMTGGKQENEASVPPWLTRMLVKTALALGAVIGFLGAAAWAARRWMPRGAAALKRGPIEILATRTLGPRKSLVLVRAQDRTLLLGVTGQAIHTLTEFDGGAGEWMAPGTPAISFEETLGASTGRLGVKP